MKLFVMLLLLPVAVSAQTQIPLSLPFEFDVTIIGENVSEVTFYPTYHDQPTTTYDSSLDTVFESLTVDTSRSGSTLSSFGDTIDWLVGGAGEDSCMRLTEARFVFDTTLSIISDLYLLDENYQCPDGNGWQLECQNVSYDSNFINVGLPIVTSGSAWSNSVIEEYNGTTVGSDKLSGAARITGNSLVKESVNQNFQSSTIQLSIYGDYCYFTSSNHHRTLELYTPLGLKAGNYEIAPGQTELTLPHLVSGLYFIRMDGAMVKVAVQ